MSSYMYMGIWPVCQYFHNIKMIPFIRYEYMLKRNILGFCLSIIEELFLMRIIVFGQPQIVQIKVNCLYVTYVPHHA